MDQLRKLTDIRCETGSEDSAVSTIGHSIEDNNANEEQGDSMDRE